MKQINPSETLQQLKKSKPHVEKPKPAAMITSKTISQLWMRLTRIYGHKWSSIAASDDGTWLAGLQDLTPQHIANGLGALLKAGTQWPPSLPEFRDMCIGINRDEGWQHKGGAYKQASDVLGLPELKAQQVVKNKERENIKKLGF